jgi:tRNA 2-thiouridine synthesizing protein A
MEHQLDARGLICPLPVLKARKTLLRLKAGDTLRITVTDKAAPKDFQLFCTESGHSLQSVQEQGEAIEIVVVRGGQI